jgi:hypothetical protein
VSWTASRCAHAWPCVAPLQGMSLPGLTTMTTKTTTDHGGPHVASWTTGSRPLYNLFRRAGTLASSGGGGCQRTRSPPPSRHW